jgi:glycosyltransferase involved in cell wall biosynthesis
VIEAMAMAKAIAASNIEANAEVIEHGVTGLLVPVSDPKALAAEMVQLSGDAKLVQELGEHAYEKAFDQLQLDDMTLRVEDVYRRNVSSTRTFKRLVRRTTYKMPD